VILARSRIVGAEVDGPEVDIVVSYP